MITDLFVKFLLNVPPPFILAYLTSNVGACTQAVGNRLTVQSSRPGTQYKDCRGFPAESIRSVANSANMHVVVDTFADNICGGTGDQSFTLLGMLVTRLQWWCLSVKCMP